MAAAKSELRHLIDKMTEEQAAKALRLLRDPVALSLLTAPPDDEPETDEERRLVGEARGQVARGEVLTTEELLRELDS